MGQRYARWRALAWRDRFRLGACALGLGITHLGLALFGYVRLRGMIERATRHPLPRAATPAEIRDAQALATLAAIAGRHGAVEATCLRQSLLLYAWLRRRGLRPALELGVKERDGPFQAHAWVELEGVPLLPADAGHRAFGSTAHQVRAQ
jgi:hypothetical protein